MITTAEDIEMVVEKNGYQYFDWNGQPIRIKDEKIEDYAGQGERTSSRLKYSRVMKPGGDLSHLEDEEELRNLLEAFDGAGTQV